MQHALESRFLTSSTQEGMWVQFGSAPATSLANQITAYLTHAHIESGILCCETSLRRGIKQLKAHVITSSQDPEDETFKLTTEEGRLSVEKEQVKSPPAKEIEPDVIFDQEPEANDVS
eukprot:5329648-Amphidinium_carterae.1